MDALQTVEIIVNMILDRKELLISLARDGADSKTLFIRVAELDNLLASIDAKFAGELDVRES